ncbi:MAG: 1-deoxy-D-xylulose-5-phosphate reductoisomerase [Lachnospiraceae bacterium]|nr:1-deoxy-D-xylulose-5-phosphate reductoisomerase [Lachnospiraceae bacterium]
MTHKNIVVLGSTGSIGTQTLEVVRSYHESLSVLALAAGTNVDLMEKQIREFKPQVAVMWTKEAAEALKIRVADTSVKVLTGMEGLLEISVLPDADIVLTAVVGMIGIRPTIAAIEAGKDIALANKETLVCAGHIIMPLAEKKGVKILPVDSEHSAIFQSLNGEHGNKIKKILLTASGGPFRGMTTEQLRTKTVEDALKHPNWSMGRKITVDSASLVNKGLEVLEASWLFGVEPERVQVVVHPQSILHSAVEFEDGAVIGQMGTPDMKLPIQYALFYPERLSMNGTKLDLFEVAQLTFEKPDTAVFKGLPLALRAAQQGGSMPTVFNAANELAVAGFLDKKISFLEIYEIIEKAMDAHKVVNNPSVEEILAAEAEVYDLWKSGQE